MILSKEKIRKEVKEYLESYKKIIIIIL